LPQFNILWLFFLSKITNVKKQVSLYPLLYMNINLLRPNGYVMHQQFNIQQL